MTDNELAALLHNLEESVNDAIDKLIVRRQRSINDKQRLSYTTKKLEVIIGAIHKIQDRMPVDFKL